MNTRFQVRVTQTADIIDDCETLGQAEQVIEANEREDRANGNYEHGFYEIYDTKNDTAAVYYS